MVFMSTPAQRNGMDNLFQSVDLAVKHLLDTESDPLALAMYLWVFRAHNLSLNNSDRLASWGIAWAQRAFISESIGRKKDEQIASAALALAALATTRALSTVENDLRSGVQRALAAELDRRSIPLRHPVYGAMLLLAACRLKVDEPRAISAAESITSSFTKGLPGRRAFGAGIIVQLLQENQKEGLLTTLTQHIQKIIDDPRVTYEDRLYLLHALWLSHDDASEPNEIIGLAESFLKATTTWSSLMDGIEEIPSAGDGHMPVTVSHLYRAALLDISLRFQVGETERAQARLDARYGGRKLINMAAFGFGALLLGGTWFLLGKAVLTSFDAGWRYWLLNDYHAMSSSSALFFLAEVVFATLFLPVTLVITWTLWFLLIRTKATNDREIAEVLGHRLRGAFLTWLTLIALGVLIGLFTGAIGPAFTHAIGGK
jgi:hypothetical protein